MYIAGLAVWAAFLVAAMFYTRQARHPEARPLAAYVVFVIVFAVSSSVIFGALTYALQALGRAMLLADPIVATVFLFLVFVPAFFIARWQLRKPPHRPKQP